MKKLLISLFGSVEQKQAAKQREIDHIKHILRHRCDIDRTKLEKRLVALGEKP